MRNSFSWSCHSLQLTPGWCHLGASTGQPGFLVPPWLHLESPGVTWRHPEVDPSGVPVWEVNPSSVPAWDVTFRGGGRSGACVGGKNDQIVTPIPKAGFASVPLVVVVLILLTSGVGSLASSTGSGR